MQEQSVPCSPTQREHCASRLSCEIQFASAKRSKHCHSRETTGRSQARQAGAATHLQDESLLVRVLLPHDRPPGTNVHVEL